MSLELLGVAGVGAVLALLAFGVPIAAALGLVGFVGLAIAISPEAATIKAGVVVFQTISHYELGVLPLFLLMAQLLFSAGASRAFFDSAAKFVGHRPGGLALAAIGGCAGFGSISGSSLATAATMGLAALPEMRRQNYSPALATGALAAGGTLGVLIPPSGAFIVYGIIAEQSIGRLFVAGIVPGLTQALFYMIAIYVLCKFNPSLGPPSPRATWRERFASLASIADIVLLTLFVIGGLTVGWFTPTESAALGCTGALLICAWRRKLTWATLQEALAITLRTSGMIYAIIVGALIFSTFVSITGFADIIAEAVRIPHLGALGVIVAMALVILVLGMFLDGMAMMLLVTPIFLPIIMGLGLDPIWFGVFLIRTMEIGFITPPIGMNVYVIQSIAKDVPVTTVFRGVTPFLAADFLHLALLIGLPALALFLPNLVGA
ncbi:MAG: TRAP transporter large permease [Hyphomonadaceae bacterium]|nr:TRAP transporter large permease [Hyphomonadaceae bacterium]